MDLLEFFDHLEKWEEEKKEDYRRKAITSIMKSKPSILKDAILKSALDRIMWYFENDKFGVVSICKATNSKKKNFEIQLRFVNKLKMQKLHCIAHIGFWEKIGTRSLFIPQITKKQVITLAKKYKLNTYIWGKKRYWKCYRTCDDDVITTGDNLKIICPDEEFLLFSRIKKREQHLLALLDYIKDESEKDIVYHRETVSSTKRKLADFERMEDEIISAKKWNRKRKF